MNYLTNYYKNLCEQLQAKVNHLENILNETSGYAGDSSIHKVMAAERKAMTPEQKAAELARQLGEVNARRTKAGQKPFANMDEYAKHSRAENAARRTEREAATRARIEAYSQTPAGQAEIARGMMGAQERLGGSAAKHDSNPTDNIPVYRTPGQ